MKNQIETVLINEDYLKDKIYIIRGQKVMIDSDLAKHSIICIDDYIGNKVLELLSFSKKNIPITIISDNKAKPPVKRYMINDFIKQNNTNSLSLIKSNNECHDEYKY